jgi:hypothetical protein
VGTLVMDTLNYLFARTGLVLKIDVRMIGRMTVGWMRGRLRYDRPSQIEPHAYERLLGYLAHYAIGLILAAIFVLGWDQFMGGPPSPAWAIVYGFATTVISEFVVYPSMGLGICGRRSPDGIKAFLSPLANHLFYGLGMAAALAVV